MESVKDKVVIITGASSGIGAGTAVLFAKYGSRLVLTGRNTPNLAKVVQECCDWGLAKDKILSITADLENMEDINCIVSETIQKFNRIDALVNNAAIAEKDMVESMSIDDMEEQFAVNMTAPVILTKLAIPHLKKSKGSIINVSSMAGLMPVAEKSCYCMTKAALDMFTSTLTLELASSGVRVNSVCPGVILTPMHRLYSASEEATQELLTMSVKMCPSGRLGLPEDVANAIVFLASDAASFINGVKLPVDGGVVQTSAWYQVQQEAMSGAGAQ